MQFRWLVCTGVVGIVLDCSSQQPEAGKAELMASTHHESTLADDTQAGENPAAEAWARYYERGSTAAQPMRTTRVDDTPPRASARAGRPESGGIAR